MHLKCRSCKGGIKPDEPMVIVVTAKPSEWRNGAAAAAVGVAPGVWHWACAPQAVRQYAPAVLSVQIGDAGEV